MTDSTSADEVKKQRVLVSGLIFDVLTSKISVAEALLNYPKNKCDATLGAAFHALVHYEADEDLRKRDLMYCDVQNDYLESLAQILARGEEFPVNIISAYNELYKELPIYPQMTRDNIFKRLMRFINV